jgi:hypothetical protein
MITDLFHIIDLSGQLLNKAEPSDSDTKPFDLFMKFCKTVKVSKEKGEKPELLQYVSSKDVPQILFQIFVGQPDEKRIDAAMLI